MGRPEIRVLIRRRTGFRSSWQRQTGPQQLDRRRNRAHHLNRSPPFPLFQSAASPLPKRVESQKDTKFSVMLSRPPIAAYAKLPETPLRVMPPKPAHIQMRVIVPNSRST